MQENQQFVVALGALLNGKVIRRGKWSSTGYKLHFKRGERDLLKKEEQEAGDIIDGIPAKYFNDVAGAVRSFPGIQIEAGGKKMYYNLNSQDVVATDWIIED